MFQLSHLARAQCTTHVWYAKLLKLPLQKLRETHNYMNIALKHKEVLAAQMQAVNNLEAHSKSGTGGD